MKNLTDIFLKARSGVYKDTSENRRLHRVGQKYGESKQSEDNEKGEKEVDPAKELAAVNKVISAIAAGKINLPNQEVVKLYEKRRKLEEAKTQAEKINTGVKVNEKKGGNKEVNEEKPTDSLPTKEQLENAKNGSTINIVHFQTGSPAISYTKKNGQWFAENSMTRGEVKSTPEQMMRTLEGYNRKLYVRKMNLLSDSKETKSEQVKQEKEKVDFKGSDKTGDNEEKETYTRVKFDDLPNSGKVNLKKYLSDKVKRTADENLGILSKVSTENLKKMEAGLVKEFNSQFDDLPKSRRAEKLYSIMKVKAELAQRGNKG